MALNDSPVVMFIWITQSNHKKLNKENSEDNKQAPENTIFNNEVFM